METIGDRIRALREARGMSTSDVARHLGILAPNYRKYENGERHPKQEQVERLAKLFGCPSTDITERRVDRLADALNSGMVRLAAFDFEAYENLCFCWSNYGCYDTIETFFLDFEMERNERIGKDWPNFGCRVAELKEVFLSSDMKKCSDLDEKTEQQIKFMALFIDYFHHRRDYDIVLSEVKEALGIQDDVEARIQFACRVALPAFSVLRDMALYCDGQDDPDMWKALALAENDV